MNENRLCRNFSAWSVFFMSVTDRLFKGHCKETKLTKQSVLFVIAKECNDCGNRVFIIALLSMRLPRLRLAMTSMVSNKLNAMTSMVSCVLNAMTSMVSSKLNAMTSMVSSKLNAMTEQAYVVGLVQELAG